MLNNDPESLLQLLPPTEGKILVCIDEIQYLDNPTNFLKLLYDEYRDRIKLFVTGSSSFYIDRKFKDSLAGRKKIFEIGTLSFQEFLHFKQQSHLIYNELYKSQFSALFDEYMRYGGYPELVLMETA
jgi:predicted AAA+ superfamily ATPase